MVSALYLLDASYSNLRCQISLLRAFLRVYKSFFAMFNSVYIMLIFFISLNSHTVDIEQPDGMCSITFFGDFIWIIYWYIYFFNQAFNICISSSCYPIRIKAQSKNIYFLYFLFYVIQVYLTYEDNSDKKIAIMSWCYSS